MSVRATAALLILITLAPACGSRGRSEVPEVQDLTGPPIARPAEVIGELAFRDAAAFGDRLTNVLRLVFNTGAPAVSGRLEEVFAPRIGLSDAAMKFVDLHRPVHVVVLAGGTTLAALPLSDPAAFSQALAESMKSIDRKGPLVRYRVTRGDGPALEIVAGLLPGHVLLGERPASFTAAPYLARTLLPATPAAPLEARLSVSNLLADRTRTPEQVAGAWLDQLKARVAAPLPGKKQTAELPADAQAAVAILDALNPFIARFAGLSEITVTVDFTPGEAVFALQAVARETGAAHELLAGQRPDVPLSLEGLPPTPWFLLSDRARAGQTLTALPTPLLLPTVIPFLKRSPDALEILEEMEAEATAFTGDYTVALHTPPNGAGATISMVFGTTDLARAKWATVRMLSRIAGGADAPGAPDAVPETVKDVPVVVFQLELPAGSAPGLMAGRLLGGRPHVVVAGRADRLHITLGISAEAQMERLLAPWDAALAPPLARHKALVAAGASFDRVGVLLVSVVDLARELVSVSSIETRASLGALKTQHTDTAVTLSWGVDRARTRFEVEARVPIDHVASVVRPIMTAAGRLVP